jgi:site-specific recombinase XerD
MNDFFKTIRQYLNEYLPRQKCLSENTVKAHRNTLNLFIEFLRNEKNMQLDGITFEIIDRQLVLGFLNWLEERRNSRKTSRNQRLSVLRSFFNYAGQTDCANIELELDVRKIPMARHGKKIVEYLSEDALRTLLLQPDIKRMNGLRDRFFMTLMYDTAARVGEMLNMRLCDLRIDTAKPLVYLRGKGDKLRSVPIMPLTVEHCRGFLKRFHPEADMRSADYLFYSNIHDERKPLTPQAVEAFMKKYGEKARAEYGEIPERVHPHQIRHTKAIHLYRDGYPLVLVGEYLGHENPQTTKVYAYADSEMKRKALEKVDEHLGNTQDPAIWENNEEMILQLSGLRG